MSGQSNGNNESSDEALGISSLGREDSNLVVGTKKHWRPSESRMMEKWVESGSEKHHQDKSRELYSRGLGLSRENSLVTPRYRPVTPATSAFVIAAPAAVPRIDNNSVVMPLQEFMALAMEGHEKSFVEWSNSMNEAAKIGPPNRRGRRQCSDVGLLRVVSFASPVNQFIFAKRVTGAASGGDNLLDVTSQTTNLFKSRMKQTAKKYRLRLQDVEQLPSGTKGDADQPEGKHSTKISNSSSTHRNLSVVNQDRPSGTHGSNNVEKIHEINIDVDVTTKEGAADTIAVDTSSDAVVTSSSSSSSAILSSLRASSARGEFHDYLRRQVLQHLRERRVQSATTTSLMAAKPRVTEDVGGFGVNPPVPALVRLHPCQPLGTLDVEPL